jgi:hypothetical protein
MKYPWSVLQRRFAKAPDLQNPNLSIRICAQMLQRGCTRRATARPIALPYSEQEICRLRTRGGRAKVAAGPWGVRGPNHEAGQFTQLPRKCAPGAAFFAVSMRIRMSGQVASQGTLQSASKFVRLQRFQKLLLNGYEF